MVHRNELCPLTELRAPRRRGPRDRAGESQPRGRTIGAAAGPEGAPRRSLPPRPPRRAPEARASVTRRPRAPVTASGGMTPARGHGSASGTPGMGQRRAVLFARLSGFGAPAAARRRGAATPGQRPRHPTGSPLRNRDGTRGAPAPPSTPALSETPKGTGSLSAASGPPPRRGERPAGVPRREGRAGGRPAAGRGEPDQRRSRPDLAYLQVVLRKVLAQPRYLHVLVQVEGRHFRKN